MKQQIEHVVHRCADCRRSFSKLIDDETLCSCGGFFVIDAKYRPDLADLAADQRAALRQLAAAAAKPPAGTNGKHHPLYTCANCKDTKTVIVGLLEGVGAANRDCPDCVPAAVAS